ncbi:MAG: HAMP domain-containing sensor histidine kinase [Candidatus Nomurabacteria bacterium]
MINIWLFILIILLSFVLYFFVRFYFKNRNTEYEFTSIINHTFRTPLTRINWISKELEDINISREDRLQYIQNLNNATNKLLEIVDLIVGIKDIKNKNGFFLVETSFRDIVEKSISRYREDITKKNIEFKISSFQTIPLLTLDLKKITFAIDSLIENAIIYTPENGKILIDCILKPKNKLLFYIADTGIGLSFYDKMKVFSRFYRSKKAVLAYPDGMGLRLYLSKKIIESHGGKVYAKSKGEGEGSVFFVELPINK